MQFQPKSREALAEGELIPKGTYDFECIKAEERRSKAGNDMLVLNLKLWVGDGERFLTDYILPSMDMGLARLAGFCDATGLSNLYDAGAVTADDCLGKCAKVVIGIGKNKEGEKQNNVREYKPAGQAEQAAPPDMGAAAQEPDDKDDIPW